MWNRSTRRALEKGFLHYGSALARSPAMSRFEYFTTFVSIIISLGLADLLQSAYRLVQCRDRVRFHWLPVAWGLLVLLLVALYYWRFYEFGQQDVWRNFFVFAFLLTGPVLLFLISANALPDDMPDNEVLDLERFYFERPRGFFLLLAAFMLQALLRALISGEPFLSGRPLILTAVLALFPLLAWSRNARLHTLVTLACAVLLFIFIVFYALQID
jgi:hypothetical protein